MIDMASVEREQHILEVSVLTFVCVLILIGLVVWIVRILKTPPTVAPRPANELTLDQLRREIGGCRDHIAAIMEDNHLDHEAMTKLLEKANGRLQFLLAKEITAELEASRAKHLITEPPSETDSTNYTQGD